MLRYFHVSFAHCSLYFFFRLPFDFLSLVISLFYLSYSLITLPFCARVLYNFLFTTWSRYSFAYKALIFRGLTEGPSHWSFHFSRVHKRSGLFPLCTVEGFYFHGFSQGLAYLLFFIFAGLQKVPLVDLRFLFLRVNRRFHSLLLFFVFVG